ncbi:hypothetical membrane protein, conserved, containing DUF835 domain [Thermococcus kodakarensis KOD1]|uniref:Hypothetical membrane protein, conserved, containing DUF835 domain n=1 Tax=Thermococcus kodakarensis (strain ATCC BAA-918 / JCM 12380 / KOD1) TaxID=69014 RepID=Q5JG41_THEKO|nr:DUF835 domain-containing protein [Thermococcus kodakarensis]WCN28723.1 DUF835 domain-containing protein [Thermococcus kodakarensis]WCN31020.1 DUF835 domain-containing protein [Thermococcus kodakarensis]BAD84880.1 hypothetical membrane protein, conserved, containing DUF835 domain [Thermococcus kodakarensis KOD1]
MIEVVNLITRLATWGLATYKWARNKKSEMLFLSIALWFDFLGAISQKRILEALGWVPKIEALPVVMSLMAVVEGMFFLLASLSFLGVLRKFFGQLILLLVSTSGITYVVLATLAGLGDFYIMAYPLVLLGVSLIFLGYVLFKESIWKESTAVLFPAGAILLGVINVTFPVTHEIKTVSGYLYGAGALARFMMLVGITTYSFLTINPPEMPIIKIPRGAFYTTSKDTVERLIRTMQETGNGVLITRDPPKDLRPLFQVFWVTKAAKGQVSDNIIAVSPTDIGILVDIVKKYLDSGHSLVVLDGFEYLVLENGFESTLKFLLSLKDFAISQGGTLVLLLEPRAFSEKQLKIIQREFEEFEF